MYFMMGSVYVINTLGGLDEPTQSWQCDIFRDMVYFRSRQSTHMENTKVRILRTTWD